MSLCRRIIYIYIIIIVICTILIPLVDRALVLVPVPALHPRCDCLPLAHSVKRCYHRHNKSV